MVEKEKLKDNYDGTYQTVDCATVSNRKVIKCWTRMYNMNLIVVQRSVIFYVSLVCHGWNHGRDVHRRRRERREKEEREREEDEEQASEREGGRKERARTSNNKKEKRIFVKL